jgi:zinc transport system substrate-binding protein
MKKLYLSLFYPFLLLLLASCNSASQIEEEQTIESPNQMAETVSEKQEPLSIYTTIFTLQDFLEKIGGNYVTVTNMIPIGVDAHTFEPTIREMIDIAESDGFFFSGGGMEGFIDSLKHSLRDEDVFMIEASDGVDFINGDDQHTHDHDHGHDHEHSHSDSHSDHDPHIWIDPIRSIQIAENIKNGLVELLPEQEEYFQANFETLRSDLKALDSEFKEATSNPKRKQFLVAHAGYTYWEDRYGLEQIAVTGFSPTNEPSHKHLEDLMQFTNTHGIKYIVFERNYSIKTAQIFKEEIGAEVLYFFNLENMTVEELATGEDYFSLMRKNIETLKTVLN